ncbi:glycosyltransferase family 2 protein [Tellurirhabdus rosea]|uniref:glycosyltransferase family 2 protein n=1 Tax=Tellurirhabdus rosea TaxID=2674997 RepID=UPI00224C8C87|nr:glycosyltransferase family 2 protein [Tellurirhabdus rosea]
MRNESLRLPYFLSHYSNLGVDRFILIDNNSTDGSAKLASSYSNVHVFQTSDSYKNHWYWMEYLLEKYGKNHWCVVVDIDELLSFPHEDTIRLPELCSFLESSGYTAMRALLLDMYSDKPVKNALYEPGSNPLATTPFFDTFHYEVIFPYFDRKRWQTFSSTHYTGGMRERVFGISSPITSLNKYPLFKNTRDTYLGQGMHAINGAVVSDVQGVVFHTKFLHDFVQEAAEESVREEHFNKAAYYKDFNRKLSEEPDLCLANTQSVRYKDWQQLVALGLMKTSSTFDAYALLRKKDKRIQHPESHA